MTATGEIGGIRADRSHRGRRGRRPRGGSPGRSDAIAALDLGTNNCRLLVARPNGRDFEVVDAFSRAVRLGEGVESSNRLSDAAQERAIKALRICAGKIRHHRARQARIVATEACRRASNARAFVSRVAGETGLHLDVISAEEEARFAVAGCAPLIDPDAEQLLVYDIGGGSTELIWIDLSKTAPEERGLAVRRLAPGLELSGGQGEEPVAEIADWISLPMGVSVLGGRFADIADETRRFQEMSAHVEHALAPFAPFSATDRGRHTGKLQIIGVSGTATTYGAIYLGLKSYNRARVDGLWMPSSAIREVTDLLLGLGLEGRSAHPGIGRGRAGLVLCGAAILMTILHAWPVARMCIADRGLREGMLYGLMRGSRPSAA